MSDPIEDLLQNGLLNPPDHFATAVMARVAALPVPLPRQTPQRTVLQWLALAGAGLVGVGQLVSFMFGVWAATAAG
jgi:hypothetical protein